MMLCFWFKYDLDGIIMHPKFNSTGVQTHELQIKTEHVISLSSTTMYTVHVHIRLIYLVIESLLTSALKYLSVVAEAYDDVGRSPGD